MDLRDFGAVGDGTTDDSAALKAALQAAVQAGRPLWIPVGNFAITSAGFAGGSTSGYVLPTGGLVLRGAPGLSRIVSDGGALQNSGGAMITVDGPLDVDGVSFVGGRRWFSANFPSGSTIPIWRIVRSRFEQSCAPIQLHGRTAPGQGFDRLVLADNVVIGSGDRSGATVSFGFSIPIHVVRSALISGNLISDISGEGIRVGLNGFNDTSGSNLEIIGNTVRDVWGPNSGDVHGIRVNGRNVVIANNVVENVLRQNAPIAVDTEGIYTKGGRMTITNNVLRNAGPNQGMITAKGGRTVIQGNYLEWDPSVQPGVTVGNGIRTESSNYTIADNFMIGIVDIGITTIPTLDTSPDDGVHVIEGNTIIQSPTMQRAMSIDLPARLTISGNHVSGLPSTHACAVSLYPRAEIAGAPTRHPHSVDIVGNVFDQIGDGTRPTGANGVTYSRRSDGSHGLAYMVIKDNVFRSMNKAIYPITKYNAREAPIDELVVEGNVFQDVHSRVDTTRIELAGKYSRADAASFEHGTATLSSGTTQVVVPHLLGFKPRAVQVTPRGAVDSWWVSAVTNTSFTLKVSTAPTSDVDFSWFLDL